MLRIVPDWLLYIIVIAAVVFVLFRVDQRADAPEALPDAPQTGAFLPPPSVYDPEVLVEVGPVASGMGSAFAISEDGWWLTARHVVDGCEHVGLIVSRGAAARVVEVKRALFADLALLRTDRAPEALAIDTSERRFQIGQRAFHVGFPQGRPGEAYSRLIGRETLVARGRYNVEEPVLAWAEQGRTSGLRGSLAGISGGPAIAANGQVIGVTIAESARRGRIYTAAPSSILRLLRLEQVEAQGAPAPRLTADNYGQESDDLRRELAVAQVVCVAPGDEPEMTAAFADRLIDAVRGKQTPLCVGLDPFADKVPELFGDVAVDPGASLLKFGTSLIDIAAKHAAVLKPQLGLFEQFGELGYATARMLTEYARSKGMIVILDAKRGDIGTTAEGYARATLGAKPGFDADCVTVNPYMGKDTLAPFIAMAQRDGKGVAVLVRTSNPGAGDFQDLQVGGAPVWRRVAEMLAPEVAQLKGASGWSGLMAVAGATYPDEARALREAMPSALFLVPGYGAQGASAAEAVAGFVASKQGLEGGVVSSSRAVSYPQAAQAAKSMADWRAAIEAAMAQAAGELRAACARA